MLTSDELEAMGRQLRYLRLRGEAPDADLAIDVGRHNRLVDDAWAQLQRAREALTGGPGLSEGAEMELRFCVAFLVRQAQHLLGRHGRAVAEAQLA
ncbi:MAG TPA: hypothetical protein VFE30_04200 [Anaeromyxobacteraceae bacterium]|jgi:hypothetical protein|nr:hypothetical protein [Anaeromyxobacteraceae bacterium]